MSLATSIKDLADVLNELSAAKALTGDLPKTLLLQHTLLYSIKAFFSFIFYLVSFEWLRDISYIPLLPPQINISSLFGDSMLEDPTSYIFSLTKMPKQATDQLFAGLTNSFFVSLPFSLPHLITLRRLFFQGPAAAAASILGIVAAHTLFLIGVLFGVRTIIIPYLSFEPLNYILGVLIIAVTVKDFTQQKGFKLVPFWNRSSLIRMSILTFFLTWCEETNIFHSLNNLTLNAQNTYLELYPSSTALNSFVVHITYLLAFIVGHSLFSTFFFYLIFLASRYFSSLRWFTTATITSRISKITLFLIVAFTLSSVPYYGLDYLLANRAGFLPEDPIFTNTVLSPTTVKTKYPHFFKEISPIQRDEKTPLNLDLNYFDNGVYLNGPKQQKSTPPSVPVPALTFEELNYQGEYAWIMRNQLSKDLSKMRPSVFTPMFKKPRRRYLQLRKLTDKRMEQAAWVAHQKIPIGNKAETQEGIFPKEQAPLLMKMTNFLGRAFLLPTEVESDMRDFEIPSSQSYETETENSDSDESFSAKNKNVTQNNQYDTPFGANLVLEDAQKHNQKKAKSKKTDLQFEETDTSYASNNAFLNKSSNNESLSPKKMIQLPALIKKKKKDPIKEELLFERKVQKGYSKGFSSHFSLPYERMRVRFLPVKNVIKKRYFLNHVYKRLLETDIDTFLARQPTTYKLAENQEQQLYEKRQILQRYYNWLRYYEPFEKMTMLRFRIPDTKSFVDRVYHHQFKGTLKIAQRLFRVTFESKENPEKNRVLSYDQLLYNDLSLKENPILHEELFEQNNEKEPFIQNQQITTQKEKSAPFDTVFTSKNDSVKAAQTKDKRLQKTGNTSFVATPFIEETCSFPIYAGWDPETRKFVITNRFVVK